MPSPRPGALAALHLATETPQHTPGLGINWNKYPCVLRALQRWAARLLLLHTTANVQTRYLTTPGQRSSGPGPLELCHPVLKGSDGGSWHHLKWARQGHASQQRTLKTSSGHRPPWQLLSTSESQMLTTGLLLYIR